MQAIIHGMAALAVMLAVAGSASAHGDKAHPKCKKGYELNEADKCVKKK